MSSVTVTRQDARQVVVEFARNLALLLHILDDLPGTRVSPSRRRDELALIARLEVLSANPEHTLSPDTRQLLHSAFTLARIRSQRTVRHVRVSALQHLGQRLRSIVLRHPQPAGDNAETRVSALTIAQLSRTLLRELDQKRRALNDYLDHYPDDTDTPGGIPAHAAPPRPPQRARGVKAAGARPAGVSPARAVTTAEPRRQKPNPASSRRNKSRPRIAKQA